MSASVANAQRGDGDGRDPLRLLVERARNWETAEVRLDQEMRMAAWWAAAGMATSLAFAVRILREEGAVLATSAAVSVLGILALAMLALAVRSRGFTVASGPMQSWLWRLTIAGHVVGGLVMALVLFYVTLKVAFYAAVAALVVMTMLAVVVLFVVVLALVSPLAAVILAFITRTAASVVTGVGGWIIEFCADSLALAREEGRSRGLTRRAGVIGIGVVALAPSSLLPVVGVWALCFVVDVFVPRRP